MIIKLLSTNINLINEIETNFNNFENQSINISNDFLYNPYTNYLIYIIDNKPVGYINYSSIIDRFEIVNFCVLTDYRNKGIGTKLLNEVIDIAKKQKVSNITLEVREGNENAIKLYEKSGFVARTIRKKYYDNENGILMEKEMI